MSIDSNLQTAPNQGNFINDQSECEAISNVNSNIVLDKETIIKENTESRDTPQSGSSSKIPFLRAPTLPFEKITEKVVKLDAAAAQLLGVSDGTEMNMIEFIKTITSKLSSNASTQGGLDTSKMDAETLALFCMLLTQSSKEKMIQSFKDLLNTKIQERNEKQASYIKETNEVSQKNLDAAKKAQEAEKKAKKWGIFKAVFNAIVSVITTVVAVAITAASFGSLGPAAMTFAAIAIAAAISSSAFSIASSGCTIAALCTEDPETQSKLNKWAMGLGISAMALGIVSAVGSGGVALLSNGGSMIGKILGGLSSMFTGFSQMLSGSGDIFLGAENIKLAELKKELADMKIDLYKLDETIAMLNKLIETLTNTSEDLIKNLLEGEQQAAKEVINISQSNSEIADEINAKGV